MLRFQNLMIFLANLVVRKNIKIFFNYGLAIYHLKANNLGISEILFVQRNI